MKQLSFLIKPASSACQLHCKYCFYNDVSEHREIKTNGIMQEDSMKAIIERACEQVDEDGTITFAFQGGEPTVAGLSYFEAFCAYVLEKKKDKQSIQYAIQSNGYVIDDAWCAFFAKHHFLVGISLDGYKENHDYFRLTSGNKTTYKRVMETVNLLKMHKVEFNILTVLSKQLAKHPHKLYDFYKKNKIEYIQLIPCLAGLEETHNPFALTPHLFAQFYKQFYDFWLEDAKIGQAMSVGFFDNMIPMFANIPPQQCGLLGHCSLQFVIESDGRVYPCDFYVLDEHCGGNIKDNTLSDIIQHQNMKSFLKEEKIMSPLCASCPFESICHGNCKRMNTLYFEEGYCGYQDFLTHAYPSMSQLAKSIQR